MRILLLIHRYAPALGGAERYLAGLATRLARSGHEVTVVTTDALDFDLFWKRSAGRIETEEEIIDRVRVRRFPVGHLPFSQLAFPALRYLIYALSRLPMPGGVPLGRALSRFTPYLPALYRWASSEEVGSAGYDLVCAATITLENVVAAGRLIAQRQNIPFVVCPLTHLGAGERPGRDKLSRFYTLPHQQGLVVEADGVIALTETEKRFYVERGQDPGLVQVAPPGIDMDALLGGDGVGWRQRVGMPPDRPLILSLSTLAADKGTVTTVEAVRRLWRAGQEVGLVLAGQPTTPFQTYFDQLPEADRSRIMLLGPVSEVEKRDLLAAADLFCMPSRTESFGIVYLEAWLYQTPVIGANTWGVKNDVIDPEENGLLVDFGDVSGLADALKRLIDDPDLRLRLGKAGYTKLIERYNWEQSFAGVMSLFDKLVGSGDKTVSTS